MFYFLPSRGDSIAFQYGELGSKVNVLDTSDNTVECMPLNVLYESGVEFRNARRLNGRFSIRHCVVDQKFGTTPVSLCFNDGFKIGNVTYHFLVNNTKDKKFRSLYFWINFSWKPIVVLKGKVDDAFFRFFITCMVKFSDYCIIPVEIFTGVGYFSEELAVLFVVFDTGFNYLGCHLSGADEFLELCSSVDKSLAAKLTLADKLIYF